MKIAILFGVLLATQVAAQGVDEIRVERPTVRFPNGLEIRVQKCYANMDRGYTDCELKYENEEEVRTCKEVAIPVIICAYKVEVIGED